MWPPWASVVSRYIVHVLHRLSLQSAISLNFIRLLRVETTRSNRMSFRLVSEVKMSRQTTLGRFGFKKSISHRNSVMETKVPDFVSTMSRTIKCNHCSKLIVNQQGLSIHEKCVHSVSGMTKAAKIISLFFKISASALFLKYS